LLHWGVWLLGRRRPDLFNWLDKGLSFLLAFLNWHHQLRFFRKRGCFLFASKASCGCGELLTTLRGLLSGFAQVLILEMLFELSRSVKPRSTSVTAMGLVFVVSPQMVVEMPFSQELDPLALRAFKFSLLSVAFLVNLEVSLLSETFTTNIAFKRLFSCLK
jgi:hypothetical protein